MSALLARPLPGPSRVTLALVILLGACTGQKPDTAGFFSDDDSGSDDRTAPLVALDAPEDGATVSGTVSWSATASDDVRVDHLTLYVNDEEVDVVHAQPWAGEWDSTSVTNGAAQLEVVASDGAGNEASDSVDVIVSNDSGLDPDAVLISSPAEGSSLCGTVNVQATTSDVVVQVTFALDGDDQDLDTSSPFAWQWDTTSTWDGEHVLTATAADAEGRQAQDSVTVDVLNDDAECDNPPSVVFTDPRDGDWLLGTVDLELSASDDDAVVSVGLYVDSGLLLTDTAVPYGTALDTTVFEDGAHTLRAVATDTASQTGETEITVHIDNTAPIVHIDAPADGDTISGTVDLEASATDNLGLSLVLLSVDGAELEGFDAEPYALTLDTTALDFGPHTLGALAADQAGGTAEDEITVVVDNPPVLTFTSPTDTTVGGVVDVTVEATDDQGVADLALYEEGTLIDESARETTLTTSLSTCAYAYGATVDFSASATDLGGQDSDATLTLTVDQPLQVDVVELASALDYTATLSADVGDDETISSVVFQVDGVTVGTATSASSSSSACFTCGCKVYQVSWSTASASEGDHTLTVTATNASGDVASDTGTITIDYDHDGDGYDSEFYGGDDCDDGDTGYHPGASETCDGTDEDCDGSTDEDYDVDGDGYLDETLCAGLSRATDCDDGDASVHPGASETCDLTDEDCDGHTDETGAATASTSTFGSGSDTLSSSGLTGNVYKTASNLLITSFSAYVNPGSAGVTASWGVYSASSLNGTYTLVTSTTSTIKGSSGYYSSPTLDVELDAGTYYLLTIGTSGTLSHTGDKTPSFTASYGLTPQGWLSDSSALPASISTDPSTTQLYTQKVSVETPATADLDLDADGWTTACGDCDDADSARSPGTAEACNRVDDDCDGDVDEDFDADGDGWGAGATCGATADCDDADADISPDATEVCDGLDNDCSGEADDDAVDGSPYYADTDGDGYGDPDVSEDRCAEGGGWVADARDCDDADAASSPAGTEVCDGADNDCDGSVDEGFDADGDGYGSCNDCDDTDADVSPDATEICGNGVDDDCDGVVQFCQFSGSYEMGDSYWRWRGESADGYGADHVAFVGDTNGDGDDDLLIADSKDSSVGTWSGAAYLLLGPVTASGTLGSTGSTEIDGAAGDLAGTAVDGAGDQNGDGYADLLIGARGYHGASSYSGGALIFLGPVTAAAALADADMALQGGSYGDYAGNAAVLAGDMDGDDEDDFVIGAPGAKGSTSGAGRAYLVYGPVTGDVKLASVTDQIYGISSTQDVGAYLAANGDADGDGLADFLVSIGGSDGGSVALFEGGVSGTVSYGSCDAFYASYASGDDVGTSQALVDLDGDGYDDLLLAAPGSLTVYVFFSPVKTGSYTITSYGDAKIKGTTSGGEFGSAISGADIDHDGSEDLLIGAENERSNGTSSGSAYLFFGPITGSITSASADGAFKGDDANDYLGASVALGGDEDGDGAGDLLISATGEDGSSGTTGAAYILPFSAF